MSDGEIGWLEIPGGDDCGAVGRFYSDAFGWTVSNDNWTTWFHLPGGLGGAVVGEPEAPGPLLYLATDDLDAALRRIQAGGGTVVLDRTEVGSGVGFRALFRDPAGTLLGLFERPREAGR